MRVLILTLLLHLTTANNRKCCDSDSYLRKNHSVYFCDKDNDKRLQVFTKQTDLLKREGHGKCVEAHQNVTEYTVRNHTIVEESPIAVNFYPKCCPLGYFYDSVIHSCVWRKNMNESFIKQNFIRVGLPQCLVIVDYKLTPGNFSMELGNLYIGDLERFKDGEFCMDLDRDGGLVARGCYEDLAICAKHRCIRKCCPDGQSFVNGSKCRNTYQHGLDLAFTDRVVKPEEPFAIIHKKYGCRIYILKPRIQFYVETDGTFYAFSNKTNSYERYTIDEKSYCIEHVQKQEQNLNGFKFFMCFKDDPPRLKFLAERWAKIISCISLVLIIAIYVFFPEMLNLFGLILLSYNVTTLATFIIFVYVQFERDLGDSVCYNLSFASSFLVWSSFTWLNVMCFNIWWTFGSPKSFKTAKEKKNELKRFFLYNLYAWGVPAGLTLISYLSSKHLNIPYVIRPILGSYKCYWERRPGNYGMLLFYVIPLVCMELINLVLYVRTMIYCLKVRGEINKLNDARILSQEKRKNYHLDKDQLLLVLKLSIIMGIFFVFEVISSIFDCSKYLVTEYIEMILDLINCLQGVFILLIFGCKRKVYRFYRNKIFSSTIRKSSASSTPTATTQMTEPLNSKPRIRNV